MKFFYGLILIVGAVSLSVVADVLLKKSGFSNIKLIALGFLLYGLEAIPVALAFQKINFGPVFIIWSAFSVIIGLVVANLMFKELYTSHKILALIFALAAIYLSSKS
ncbi:MAG: hypothetical protein HYT63_01100 [Candidatus Yanofskybacteria bacterium]|nr:hypothetical protein [Candidatus Yanofskybacteria bacterium]